MKSKNIFWIIILSILGLKVEAQLAVQPTRTISTSGNITALNTIKPANEVNCFANFNHNSTGNSKINAYLLSLLVHYNYPTVIAGNNDDFSPSVLELYHNEPLFLSKFKQKVAHFFNEATIVRVGANNNRGYDPEAMFISTDNYIIISFRGTDRIAMKPGIHLGAEAMFEISNYTAGEWVVTDFDIAKIAPPHALPGRVHRGFSNSLQTMMPKLVDSLRKYNYSQKKVWITGHSLGGAHAQLCAAYLKKGHNIPVQGIYTYASPHVGDANFVAEIDRLFSGTTFQRFEFMDDPATLMPLYSMGFARAGIRNFYKEEKGSGNYLFNTSEIPNDLGNLSPFFCMHHPHWYARAAFFELTENDPSMLSKVPACPLRPTFGCSAIDNNRVENPDLVEWGMGFLRNAAGDLLNNISIVAGRLSANITGSVLTTGEGVYKITCLQGGKSLATWGRCRNENGCPMVLWGDDGGTNMRFEVAKYGFGFGLKIKNSSTNQVLDVPILSNSNGTKLTTWSKHIITPIPNNQIWYLVNVGPNKYILQNEKTGKVLTAESANTGTNGCEVKQWDYIPNAANQVWVFSKVN